MLAAYPQVPSLAEACHQRVAATALHIKTTDGVTLYAATFGRGTVGIVFAAQHYGTSCEWVPEARLLANRGYRVIVLDYRGLGNSEAVTGARSSRIDNDVAAAAAELRARGARTIVLVGSLLGASPRSMPRRASRRRPLLRSRRRT